MVAKVAKGGRSASPRSQARRLVRRGAAIIAAILVPVALLAANLSPAAIIQTGSLRITLLGQVMPYKLPRHDPAPIAVLVSGHVASVTGGIPEQLRGLTVKVNRHAVLQSRGLPTCQISSLQPSSTSRALRKCGPALIGSGQFWAHIVLPEQEAYPTEGRLLVFNGRLDGRPAIFAHIYTSHPFVTSFVIPFQMHHLRSGLFGTELVASLPTALGEWGFVDRIKLTLKRKYRWHGRQQSYFNAACPALKGSNLASYQLAAATFSFSGNKRIAINVTKACGVTS